MTRNIMPVTVFAKYTGKMKARKQEQHREINLPIFTKLFNLLCSGAIAYTMPSTLIQRLGGCLGAL